MTPGACISAAIEIAAEIDRGEKPADAVVDAYFRTRRYAGAKDRRAITARVWDMLRHRARLDWWMARTGSTAPPGPRARAIADLALSDKARPEEIRALFDGRRHCPEPLDATENALAEALAGRPLTHHTEMPPPVALEYPDWLDARLRTAFGANLEREMTALNQPAPVDLRVNLLRTSWEEAMDSLTAEHVTVEPTPLSPIGLRLSGTVRLGGKTAYRDGQVEVQDDGSQAVSLLVDARPGMTVVDFCAGAGGKTLALAAAMGDGGRLRGRLIACDVFSRRLDRMRERLGRAGADGVQRRVLSSEDDTWVADNAGTADRVLLDVPCSGSGTWRRHPEAKWRLTPEDVKDFVATQRRILASASRLVAPGGRLVYVTCSVLPDENEEQMAWFAANADGFRALDMAGVWAETVGGDCPAGGPFLRLSPASTGCDGFFCAVLERTQ